MSASFDRDGGRVVTAGRDGTARVWNARTGESEAVMEPGTGHLETAAFSPDGTRVVTAGPDSVARVWDAATGHLLARLPHKPTSKVLDAEFSPAGTPSITTSNNSNS